MNKIISKVIHDTSKNETIIDTIEYDRKLGVVANLGIVKKLDFAVTISSDSDIQEFWNKYHMNLR